MTDFTFHMTDLINPINRCHKLLNTGFFLHVVKFGLLVTVEFFIAIATNIKILFRICF